MSHIGGSRKPLGKPLTVNYEKVLLKLIFCLFKKKFRARYHAIIGTIHCVRIFDIFCINWPNVYAQCMFI